MSGAPFVYLGMTDLAPMETKQAEGKVRKFLPEIQALRALAVLMVVAYHLEPRWLPGGFVGVDVFFVISGFLITGHMLREVAKTGTISLRHFWAARIRRILPAALLTVVVVLVVTLMIAPMTQWPQIGIQALASTFYVQNWALASNSVDYLAATESATALQHFWSLAVEEQFYVFWPLLVLLAAYLVRKANARLHTGGQLRRAGYSVTRCAGLLFALVTAASLVFGIWYTAGGSPAAYFITPTRIWELGLGGLLALTLTYTDRLPHLRSLLAAAGLASILAAAFLLDGATPFPGTAALLPVLGTMAIIAAGRTGGELSLHRLVDLTPVQWTGNISYSLYLWHWPLIVFYKTLAEKEPGPVPSLLLLAASFGLAALSYYYVETPVRRFGWLNAQAWRPLGAGAVATALVGTLAFVPGNQQERILAERAVQASALLAAPPEDFGAEAMSPAADRAFAAESDVIVPDPSLAREDNFDVGDCASLASDPDTKECEFGDEDAEKTVALVGDSHAAQWLAALEPVAGKQDWRLVTYLHNSCPFTTEMRVAERDEDLQCTEPNRETLDRIIDRGDVDAVVTSYYANVNFVDSGTGHRPGAAGFAENWNALADAGIEVYPLMDTPRPREGALAPDCVSQSYDEPQECGQPRSEGFDGQDLTREAAELAPRARVLDLSDAFCGVDACPAVIGNVLLYADKNHITRTYMNTLAPRLEEELLAAMEEAQ
ncbi:Peptidoglycan/LPS O-acetylase OafA/YrhL, contains acyltransferase and SGNH-hydrolase domains [Arthrobacter sp. VKM Ac-2550]|nr:Peptidoglycan/LPS O-acetylase OafA/YrhL, contains acyltransferase and SGNH-hydrolase domains [Arthrobacter sp. VKM Ac-2550]